MLNIIQPGPETNEDYANPFWDIIENTEAVEALPEKQESNIFDGVPPEIADAMFFYMLSAGYSIEEQMTYFSKRIGKTIGEALRDGDFHPVKSEYGL